jgi:hypothetical protein
VPCALLHVLGYVGTLPVRDATLVAAKVFANMRAEASKA